MLCCESVVSHAVAEGQNLLRNYFDSKLRIISSIVHFFYEIELKVAIKTTFVDLFAFPLRGFGK